MAVTTEERAFFVATGEHIAALRKAHNVTQVQRSSSPRRSASRSKRCSRIRSATAASPSRRCPPWRTHTLSVSLDELFGEDKPAARAKRGPVPQWQQHIEAIAKLPKARQRFVTEMLQTVLAQH